ncbi:MAG: HAD family hydrolase [Thermoguttaceae bacterium]
MPCSAILFDLDGTLLDTLDDIADSANTVLADFGYPTHPVGDYRFFVGGGVAVLFEKSLPPGHGDPETVRRLIDRFFDVYQQGWNVKTHLYAGVAELLDRLVERGLKLAVLSNKPHTFTAQCVARYMDRWPVHPVFGQRDGVPRKPDPTAALQIAAELGVAPADFLYLGDTGTDMKTARAAGMLPVGALWGFRPEDELRQAGAAALISTPLDLLTLVSPQPTP